MSRGAVLRYRRLETVPGPGDRAAPAATARSIAFAAFIADWVAAGPPQQQADLYRALKAKGFAGGYDASARRYLNRLIGSSGRPGRKRDHEHAGPTPAERTPPSARKLSFRVANPKPDSHSARVLRNAAGAEPGRSRGAGGWPRS